MLKKFFLSGSIVSQFIQVLPVSLMAAAVFAYVRHAKRRRRFASINERREVVLTIFVCYLTGLLALVWTPSNFWTYIWYYLLNGSPGTEIGRLFVLEYNLVPSIILYWKGELTGGSWVQFMAFGNVLMFLPLGLLLPFVDRRINWRNMLLVFFGCSLLIEVIQPVVGRSFDVDDLIYNSLGGISGFLLFSLVRKIFPRVVSRCRGTVR